MDSEDEHCSICLDSFTEPKGLPCFHTFCRECLQMYINRDLANNNPFFNCPMCRANTKPAQPNKPRKEWAKLFPTNNYVLKQYSGSQQKKCTKHHNEILDISCKTCKVIICSQCCLSNHEKCEKTLTKVNATKIKKNILAHQKGVEMKLKPLEDKLDKLDQLKESTETQVKQITKELLDYIHNQKETWLKEIGDAHVRKTSSLQEHREALLQIQGKAQENIEEIDILVGSEKGSDINTTVDYQPKHSLMSMEFNLNQSEESIDFRINKHFSDAKNKLLKEDMLDRYEKPASAGMVTTDVGDDDTGATAYIGATAMEISEVATESISSGYTQEGVPVPFSFVTSANLSQEQLTGVNDMILLPDQSFLITEACFKKVWKFSTLGQSLNSVTYNTEPYGLCLLQDNYVAVSIPYQTIIKIYTYDDLNEVTSISLGKKYFGLGSDNNEKIFALYRDQCMCVDIISKNTRATYEVSHVVKLPSTFYFCDEYRLRVLPSGNMLIITPASVMNVVCVNQNGGIIFHYKGESGNNISSVGDIAISTDFIYVADKEKNKIHRIKHDGSFVDIPLTSNDRISKPKKIFLSNGNWLAVLSKPNRITQIHLFSG